MQNISKNIPFSPNPLYRPPAKLNLVTDRSSLSNTESNYPQNIINTDINLLITSQIDTDFEENSPYQEGIISKTYQRPDG